MNALSPPRPRFARPRFALSRSDWAIRFPTQTPVGWFPARSLHLIRTIGSEYLSHSTVYIACRASESRYALGPYNTVDPVTLPEAMVTVVVTLPVAVVTLPAAVVTLRVVAVGSGHYNLHPRPKRTNTIKLQQRKNVHSIGSRYKQ